LEPLRFGHDFIGTEHVLLGILKAEGGIVAKVLKRMGVDHTRITTEITEIVGTGPRRDSILPIPYTPRARKALALAENEAKALKRTEIGPEHIFLGLLQEGGGVAALVLTKLGVTIRAARNAVIHELGAD
jgi:ATP-dependent Clp protease ATP-binding subunit ClpC